MKLSIVTINFNHLNGLYKTANSVISQNWKDFEWIIIDGGSKDGSKEYIATIASHTTYWCSEQDKGVYDAMNKGLAHAQGEYVLFLNSGDYLLQPDTLYNVFSCLTDADILVGEIYRNLNGRQILDKGFLTDDITGTDLLRNSLPHQASFIRKALFSKFGNYDSNLKIVGDWKFFIQSIVLGNCSIYFLRFPTTQYEANGLSDNNPTLNAKERKQVLNELFQPRILKDYELAQSLSDITRYPFYKKLYGLLYRFAAIHHSIHK